MSTSTTDTLHVLPIVDLAAASSGDVAARLATADQIDRACREIGFFVVTGHGVEPAVVDRMDLATRAFFGRPDERKSPFEVPGAGGFRGWYAAVDTEDREDRPDTTAGEATPMRLRETFEVGAFDGAEELAAAGYDDGWIERVPPNVWPDDPEFIAAWREYYGVISALAQELARLMALVLGLDEQWFADKFDRESSYLSANYYLAQAHPPAGDRLRLTEHTDIGMLTVLHQDESAGGLEVLDRSGTWRPVRPVPGTFIVNLGDMLAKWTNDRWVATQHRVRNPVGVDAATTRLSIPFFQHPNLDVLVECLPTCSGPDDPPKYPAVLVGDWSSQRIDTYGIL